MIYFIYEQNNLIAETDNLQFLKTVAKKHPGCLVKEARTGKVFKVKLVEKTAPVGAVKPGLKAS